MKTARNRIVTIGDFTGQLQNIFRLKRNSHARVANGVFNGINCYFYVVKTKTGGTCYFISSDKIDTSQLMTTYKVRWNIENFHRTSKQSLGLGHCQMRAIEKQRLHALYVMYAYAIASVEKKFRKLACIEDAIRYIRAAKTTIPTSSYQAPGENLC